MLQPMVYDVLRHAAAVNCASVIHLTNCLSKTHGGGLRPAARFNGYAHLGVIYVTSSSVLKNLDTTCVVFFTIYIIPHYTANV